MTHKSVALRSSCTRRWGVGSCASTGRWLRSRSRPQPAQSIFSLDAAFQDLVTAQQPQVAPQLPAGGDVSFLFHNVAVGSDNDAISRDPRSPCLYEKRGEFRVNRGTTAGAADVPHALQLNPADRAATFEGCPRNPVAKEAAQHGERATPPNASGPSERWRNSGRAAATPCTEWAAQKLQERISARGSIGTPGPLRHSTPPPPTHRRWGS